MHLVGYNFRQPALSPVNSPVRYTPFDVDLHEVTSTHLADLQDVSEGWYVEYKSQLPQPRDLAKSISSFANRYGGWLILGIKDDPNDNTAASFPGISTSSVPSAIQQLRDATKDLLQPTVPFFHRILKGPIDEVSLPTRAFNRRSENTRGSFATSCSQQWPDLHPHRRFFFSSTSHR